MYWQVWRRITGAAIGKAVRVGRAPKQGNEIAAIFVQAGRDAETEEAIMSTLLQQHQRPAAMPGLGDCVAAQRASPRSSDRHPPAFTVSDGAIETPRTRWRVILKSIVATLREWHRRSVARRELASFDARMLRDIGIDPGTVDYELRQSFWRPLRDWRY
jgi:uncharacterized protein YjiS (DUF1127 family)